MDSPLRPAIPGRRSQQLNAFLALDIGKVEHMTLATQVSQTGRPFSSGPPLTTVPSQASVGLRSQYSAFITPMPISMSTSYVPVTAASLSFLTTWKDPNITHHTNKTDHLPTSLSTPNMMVHQSTRSMLHPFMHHQQPTRHPHMHHPPPSSAPLPSYPAHPSTPLATTPSYNTEPLHTSRSCYPGSVSSPRGMYVGRLQQMVSSEVQHRARAMSLVRRGLKTSPVDQLTGEALRDFAMKRVQRGEEALERWRTPGAPIDSRPSSSSSSSRQAHIQSSLTDSLGPPSPTPPPPEDPYSLVSAARTRAHALQQQRLNIPSCTDHVQTPHGRQCIDSTQASQPLYNPPTLLPSSHVSSDSPQGPPLPFSPSLGSVVHMTEEDIQPVDEQQQTTKHASATAQAGSSSPEPFTGTYGTIGTYKARLDRQRSQVIRMNPVAYQEDMAAAAEAECKAHTNHAIERLKCTSQSPIQYKRVDPFFTSIIDIQAHRAFYHPPTSTNFKRDKGVTSKKIVKAKLLNTTISSKQTVSWMMHPSVSDAQCVPEHDNDVDHDKKASIADFNTDLVKATASDEVTSLISHLNRSSPGGRHQQRSESHISHISEDAAVTRPQGSDLASLHDAVLPWHPIISRTYTYCCTGQGQVSDQPDSLGVTEARWMALCMELNLKQHVYESNHDEGGCEHEPYFKDLFVRLASAPDQSHHLQHQNHHDHKPADAQARDNGDNAMMGKVILNRSAFLEGLLCLCLTYADTTKDGTQPVNKIIRNFMEKHLTPCVPCST